MLLQYIFGVSQSVGSQAATEAVARNISMEIIRMRTDSDTHQHDLNARMVSGSIFRLSRREVLQ